MQRNLLSKTSKMPCKSWSLEALTTCPGAYTKEGGVVDVCKGCYATAGFYRYPRAKATRIHNRIDWKRALWVSDIIEEIGDSNYFRWFDSGDMYALGLAEKIYEVMKATKETNHWLPTRMHKFEKFRPIIKRMQTLPNVVVRLSGDSIRGKVIPGRTTSTVFSEPEQLSGKKSVVICEAYTRGGKCGPCRSCWNPKAKVIAYPAHGQRMKKVIKEHLDAT